VGDESCALALVLFIERTVWILGRQSVGLGQIMVASWIRFVPLSPQLSMEFQTTSCHELENHFDGFFARGIEVGLIVGGRELGGGKGVGGVR
jgi:hypothetical protein